MRIAEGCQKLALELGFAELAAEVETLHLATTQVRVALLGEQVTKVTVINGLIGDSRIDPVYGLGHVRRIAFGATNTLRLGDPAAPPLELNRYAWEKADASPSCIEISVCVDTPAFQGLDVELVDLPMSKEQLDGGPLWKALQSCHLAVLVVDAPSMVTRQEGGLLYELGVRSGPPCVAVIVIGLEDVNPDERSCVVANVVNKINESTATRIPVLVAQPYHHGSTELLRTITESEAKFQPRRGAEWQLQVTLRSALLQLTTAAQQALRAFPSLGQPWKAGVRGERSQQELERWRLVCLELRHETLERCSKLIERTERQLAPAVDTLISELRSSLNTASDVGTWWTEELPYDLNRSLAFLAGNQDQRLGSEIAEELIWLRERLAAAQLPMIAAVSIPPLTAIVRPADYLPNERLARLRLLSRVSSLVLSSLSPILGALLGFSVPSLSSLSNLVFTHRIDSLLAADKQRADGLLVKVCRESVSALAEEIGQSLRRCYHDMVDELTSEVNILLEQAVPISEAEPTFSRSTPRDERQAAHWLRQARRLLDDIDGLGACDDTI